MQTIKLGLETLFSNYLHLLKGERVGLIVNPASINQKFEHAADVFYHSKEINLTTLFGPQHGIRGETQDNMIEWEGFSDRRTGLPVYSLYGETRIPTEEMLKNIDVLVFDVQDVGTRVYTFIYTMAYAMQACKKYDKRMVVLDRPNPIGGQLVEGNVLESEFASFVGLFPIAMRHGMTVGELAKMFNEAFEIKCKLDVVPMSGWKRSMWWDETKINWILPSPNMPTLDTAIVYPGMVIFEGTLVSEGRGTTRPFELIGAPYIDAYELTSKLNSLNLPGVYFRPNYYQPTFHKHVGKLCGGLQLHVLDRQKYKSVITAVAILSTIYYLYTDKFQWKQPPYEYIHDKLPIDVIFGSDKVRKQIEAGISIDEIEASWKESVDSFIKLREKYLIYS
ncbi:MAG: DUF1343 domain-containing protein [Acidobacteria bacterium]|nr:DUF1343 domain-containing protein [Acidobacteriota bacterium]